MNKTILSHLDYFKRYSVPKYIESRIQMIALNHLNLTDMGKLRDRMEGQIYYDKLKLDLYSEFAFENLIGIRKFDWDKRIYKNYKRRNYVFNDKELELILFDNEKLPKINKEKILNSIFVYVDGNNRVLVSGLASKSFLTEISNEKKGKIYDFDYFQDLNVFSSLDDLIENMD